MRDERILLSRTKITSLRMKKQTHSRKKNENRFSFFMFDEMTEKLVLSKVSKQGFVDFFDSQTKKCHTKFHFFLDTVFQEPYTFRNCNTRVADSMQIEKKGE